MISIPQKIMSLLLVMLSGLATTTSSMCADAYHWDWSAINTSAISFPEGFLMGTGISSYQSEGGNVNVWDRWAHEGKCDLPGGDACDTWNRFKDDVQLIKNVHAKAHRFSIEWSRVEPEEGCFDEAALDKYAEFCAELCAHGIAPVITLHHYNDPLWFADLGGFEKAENCVYYVRFAKKVIDRLHDNVHLWLTFNSPASYAAKGYLKGMMPPGKKNMQLMAEVLKNMLDAHVMLYKAVKADEVCAHAQVGLLHNIFQLDPARWWHPLDRLAAFMGDYITHRCIYNFFRTGVFKVYVPFKASLYHENADAPHALDFIGLNYYSHGMMMGTKAQRHPDEVATCSDQYTIYPEGFYRAIKEISHEIAEPLDIPIYVTENGIAPQQEEDRDLFLRRYLYAMYRAISEGCNVRGYFYWSLMDNYEWGTKGKKRYGLYHVDFDTFTRTLKPSAQYFIDVAKTCR